MSTELSTPAVISDVAKLIAITYMRTEALLDLLRELHGEGIDERFNAFVAQRTNTLPQDLEGAGLGSGPYWSLALAAMNQAAPPAPSTT